MTILLVLVVGSILGPSVGIIFQYFQVILFILFSRRAMKEVHNVDITTFEWENVFGFSNFY